MIFVMWQHFPHTVKLSQTPSLCVQGIELRLTHASQWPNAAKLGQKWSPVSCSNKCPCARAGGSAILPASGHFAGSPLCSIVRANTGSTEHMVDLTGLLACGRVFGGEDFGEEKLGGGEMCRPQGS